MAPSASNPPPTPKCSCQSLIVDVSVTRLQIAPASGGILNISSIPRSFAPVSISLWQKQRGGVGLLFAIIDLHCLRDTLEMIKEKKTWDTSPQQPGSCYSHSSPRFTQEIPLQKNLHRLQVKRLCTLQVLAPVQ